MSTVTASRLILKIRADDLEIMHVAQERIILGRSVGGSLPNLTWLSLLPALETVLEWREELGLFSSRQEIGAGQPIAPQASSPFPLAPRAFYEFDVTFGPANPDPSLASTSYGLRNLDDRFPYLTFGLVQKATIDGKQSTALPIHAQAVPQPREVVMQPVPVVYIWTQAIGSGMVLGRLTSYYTRLDLSISPDVSLEYSQGRFYPVRGDALLTTPAAMAEFGITVVAQDLL